jgi:hypothetical protein
VLFGLRLLDSGDCVRAGASTIELARAGTPMKRQGSALDHCSAPPAALRPQCPGPDPHRPAQVRGCSNAESRLHLVQQACSPRTSFDQRERWGLTRADQESRPAAQAVLSVWHRQRLREALSYCLVSAPATSVRSESSAPRSRSSRWRSFLSAERSSTAAACVASRDTSSSWGGEARSG